MHVGVMLYQVNQGQADIFKSRAKVFPALAGYQNDSLAIQGYSMVMNKILFP
jgi:hypothetical protein